MGLAHWRARPKGQGVAYGGGDPLAAAGVRPGEIVAGKYRIERVLGAGGMGVVVAAHHIHLDERVALKFLLPEAMADSSATARFVREARAAVKIKNEHVARVADVGVLPNGAPYMVMEYLEGNDLAEWLQHQGAMPIEQAVEFVLQACVAVADAHALGIVHRDLKPANLFCVRRSDGQLTIKVLDFGISKTVTAAGIASGTTTSAMMGSPYYMSPEQMRAARDVDARADIWALGIILFELMAGRPTFGGDTVTELALRVANEPTPSIRGLRPDVPEGLEAILFKCLQKDRQNRYQNVAELAVALLPFAPARAKASVDRISGIVRAAGLSDSGLEANLPPESEPPTSVRRANVSPFAPTSAGGPARARALLRVVGIVGIGLVIGAGVWFVRHRRPILQAQTSAVGAALESQKPPVSPVSAHAEPPASGGPVVQATPAAHAGGLAAANGPGPARSGAPVGLAPGLGSAPAPAHAASPPSCRLVSSFDKDGNEHFMQLCK
ncbi:MAG TPA: serine/threonine-protein kinase [Polyangiaceae bacterium]|nr:serine/threonine-protein kinase [Polyangiaceae bacterium]